MNASELRDPVMAVPCPTCGAKAGRWCKRPSGHSGPFVAFHAARRKLAAEFAEAAVVDEDEGVAKESATGRAAPLPAAGREE